MSMNTVLKPLKWFEAAQLAERRGTEPPPPLAGEASQRESCEFAGATMSAAINMMRNGWSEGTKKIEAMLGRAMESEDVGPVWVTEAAGYFPNVPAYLSGDPECMWAKPEGEQPKPRIMIVFRTGYAAMITAEEVMVYGAAAAAIVKGLEAAGNTVAVCAVDHVSARGPHTPVISQGIYVREFGAPLDTACVAFAFHPAFLRRIRFANREMQREFVEHGSGNGVYGVSHGLELAAADITAAIGDAGAVVAILPNVETLQAAGVLTEKRIGEAVTMLRASVDKTMSGLL